MSRYALRLLVCSLSLIVPASAGLGQTTTDSTWVTPPFHVAFVEGGATAIRAGELVALAPSEPVVDGDRVQTAAGRLELRGPEGERLFVDQGSTVDVLQPPVFRLVTGAVRVVLTSPARADGAPAVEIDTPHATAALFEAGDYRISVLRREDGDETELIVRAGRGELVNMHGRGSAGAGQRVAVSAFTAPSAAEPLGPDGLVDSFDRWVDASLSGSAPTASAAYLPAGLASYSTALDTAGSWSYEPAYGHVWYPTVVVNWQPYYHGFWRPLGYYGYTWVSHTPWAWATHHYGRWEFGVQGWFWIPGTTWGSAWVSWGVGPGYVAWCPLGWGNRPVYPAPFGRYYGRRTPYRSHAPRPPGHGGGGWTVLRAEHFRTGRPVVNHAMDWGSVAATTQAAFVEQQNPPRARLAVPRGSLSASRTAGVASERAGTRTLGSLARPGTAVGTSGAAVSREPGRRVASPASSSLRAVPSRRATLSTMGRATNRSSDPSVPAPAERLTGGVADSARARVWSSGAGDRRQGVPGAPVLGRPAPSTDRAVRSRSATRPSWTPPNTRYGIAPPTAAERSVAPQTRDRRAPSITRSGSGPSDTSPRIPRRTYRSAPSAGSAPPTVPRGSMSVAPRSPAGRAPVVRTPAGQGSRPPSGAVGRAPTRGSTPARGQAPARAGTPRRPPGR